MPSPRSSPPSTPRGPVFLGVLAACALLAAAVFDRSDPLSAAKNQVELEASDRAQSVRSAWSSIREDAAAPVTRLDGFSVLVPDAPPAFMVAAPPNEAPNSFAASGAEALVLAARRARQSETPERASRLLREAEGRATRASASALARVLLERARVAGASKDSLELQGVRARFQAADLRSASLDGTSAALLVALIAPVDVRLAASVLASDPRPLLPPVDRVDLTGSSPRMEWDPWWSEVELRLQRAAADTNWSVLMRKEARRAEALRAELGDAPSARSDRWSLSRRQSVLFALRAAKGGVRAVAVTEQAITAQIMAIGGTSPSAYRVRFDHQAVPVGDIVRPLEWLDGTSIGFTVHSEDPYRAGRRAARRLQVLRAGMVLLAISILCATVFAARATQRARRLERLRSTFVASVSHDLRTPIQSILLMAETLERGRVAGEASRGRYFATIRQEAQRLRRFVEDILDGARLDQGEKARVRRVDLETEPFMDSLERGLQERAERDGARLVIARSALPPTLHVDADAVLRVVWNLFENALRHGRSGTAPADVRVEIDLDGDRIVLAVQDQGPGVPARFSDSVFEPFERAGADERGSTGTGLGLAIVRELARAHGGDVRLADSEVGARFEATLAADAPEHEEPAA